MNFFQTLLHPDQEDDPVRAEIAHAANLLQIGEFQFLQIAYADWHGKDLTGAGLDEMFKAYMLNEVVPPWARHFARKIIAEESMNDVNIDDPQFHRFDSDYFRPEPLGVRKFAVAIILISTVLGGGLMVGGMTKSTATSVLPPYFEADQLKPAESRTALPGNQGS